MTFRIFIISGVVYTFGKLEKIECEGEVVEIQILSTLLVEKGQIV